MDELISESVVSFLKNKGMAADELPASMLEKLIGIDAAIRRRLEATAEAESVMRESRITVSAIAKEAGIARMTVYNNPVLLEYIQLNEKRQKSRGGNLEEIKGLRAKNRDLAEQLDKMLRRDAEAEELKVEIANLLKAIQEKNTQIVALQAANDRLRRDLADARSKIPPIRENIIEFDFAKKDR